jgi:hypothetical protein
MCEKKINCPRCNNELNDTDETSCLTTDKITAIVWFCQSCNSIVRLLSERG